VTPIETARLRLEPVTARNAAQLWKVMQAPNLREFQDVPRYTRQEFERRVAQRPKRLHVRAIGRFEWLVIPLGSRVAAGWVSLRLGDHAPGVAEVGYSLLDEFRGKGYAVEATEAIVAVAFGTSDIARVEACFVPENVASRKVLERIGFSQIKVQHHGAVVRGQAVDIVVFDRTREHWAAAQAGSANSTVTPASRTPK
jgi:RimJ/RimL family protein N-acetyltransferase